MCAIFGVLDYKGTLTIAQRLRMVKELGTAAEIRGTDATGIAYFQRDRLCIQKAPKPAHKMRYRLPTKARFIMGHTRMTTQGSPKQNQNNHPFSGKAGDQAFALAHNGVLYNDRELKQAYHLPETSVATDSYVAVQLIERQREVSFDSLQRVAEEVEGSFVFTILTQDGMYFVKGENPLTLYHYPELGLYLYASTGGILSEAAEALGMSLLEPEIIEPQAGEILKIDRSGHQSNACFAARDPFWDRTSRPVPTMRRRSRLPCCESQQEYIEELRSVAWCYGYDSEQIDRLIMAGYTAEDVEALLYES